MPLVHLEGVQTREIFPGHRAKMIHTEKMTLVYWQIDKGARVPEHDHHHEQVVNVLSGEYELTVDGNPHVLKPGRAYVIPASVRHSGHALSDCRLLDVFCPVREDYL